MGFYLKCDICQEYTYIDNPFPRIGMVLVGLNCEHCLRSFPNVRLDYCNSCLLAKPENQLSDQGRCLQCRFDADVVIASAGERILDTFDLEREEDRSAFENSVPNQTEFLRQHANTFSVVPEERSHQAMIMELRYEVDELKKEVSHLKSVLKDNGWKVDEELEDV